MALTKEQQSTFNNRGILERAHQVHLSLQLSPGQFTVCWFNTVDKTYLELLEIDRLEPAALTQALESISNTGQSFQSQSLSISTPHFSLVPKALYAEDEAKKMLDFNFSKPTENHRILSSEIESQEAVCIFSEPIQSLERFNHYLPGIKVNHLAKTLIESYRTLVKSDASKLFVHLEEKQFYLSYFKNYKLHFFNLFEFNSSEDFIYFFLYAIEQLKINRDEIPVGLSGKITKDSTIYDLCYKYIRDIQLLERPKGVSYSSKLQQLPGHQHYQIYQQYLCE